MDVQPVYENGQQVVRVHLPPLSKVVDEFDGVHRLREVHEQLDAVLFRDAYEGGNQPFIQQLHIDADVLPLLAPSMRRQGISRGAELICV